MNFLDKKKILITGGLGFIGSNLAIKCVELGAKVEIYDSYEEKSGANEFNIQPIVKNVTISRASILDVERLASSIKGKDIVFNCAASTSHPFSMLQPLLNLDANGRGVINILEILRRFNPDAQLVQVGTTTQIGKLRYKPADEIHPEFPMDIYSANKMVSEKYVLIYTSAHGIRGTVARLSNIYGPRACIHSPEFTFNNYFAGLALQNREVQIYGDGSQIRNALYVDDAVDALIAISNTDKVIGETFLAVHDQHYSVSGIAEATIKCFGKGSVRYIPWPKERQVIEVGDAIFSNKKIVSTVGWMPKYSLIAGLSKMNEYYQENLHHYIN